jgi:hypothetical protein
MKRWKKVLLIVAGVLLGLIGFVLAAGPAIVGSIAQSKIPSIVREKLQATATVGKVSVSWSGHVQIDDLRLVPKNFGDPLLEVKKIDVKVDVGSALGGKYVAEVDVVAPNMIVERGPDGNFNYEFPPPPPKTEKLRKESGKEAGKPPFVQANLKIRDGRVTIRGKGRETVYQNLVVGAKVDTLQKPVSYEVSLQGPLKDTLQVKGAIDLNTISGPATLTLDRLSLRNLTGAARAYSDVVELDGTVSGCFDYQLQGAPRFVGNGKLEIHDFALSVPGQSLRLGTLLFSHQGGIDEQGNGRHVLTLSSGKALAATVTADVADAFHARVFKTDLQVDSDLGALAEVLRGSGKLPKGTALAGALRLRGTCDSKGPAQADLDAGKLRVSAKVDLELVGKNLELTMDGKPMTIDGFKVRHAGTLDENGSGKNTITVESGNALAATAKVDVTDALGKTPTLQAELQGDSDLGELGKLLEKLIGLKPDMALEGAAAVAGSVQAKGADSVRAELSLRASNLVAVGIKDRKRHEIDRVIELNVVGAWDGTTKTATAELLKLSSSFATMDGKGRAALGGAAPELAETKIQFDADLEKLSGKLRSFMEKPPALGGTATLSATASGETLALVAGFKAIRFGKYGPFDATLKHDGSLDAQGSGRHTMRLDLGKALALGVTLDVTNAYKDARALQLDLRMDSDVAALSSLLPGLVELTPGTTLAGSVTLNSHAETKGAEWAAFDVAASVDRLEAVENAKHQEIDKAIRLKAVGAWDGKKRALNLQTFALTSAFATADARGGVSLAAPLSVKESSLQFQVDLEKLGSKLGLFMADAPRLAGSVSANATYAGERYNLDASVRGVKIIRNGRTTGPIDAVLAQKGTFSTAKGGEFRIDTGELTSSAATLSLSGGIRNVMEEGREGEITLNAVARPLELSKWVPDLNTAGPEITLVTVVSLKPKLITANGQSKMDGLTIAGKDDAGATITKTVRTGSLSFLVTMKDPDLLVSLRTTNFEWIDKGYSAKGGLDAQLKYSGKGATGTAKLTELEIRDDQKNIVKDPGLAIVFDIGLADQNKTIDLRRVDVRSTFLKGAVTGRLLRLDPAMEFQKIHLAFTYIPEMLGAVLKPWLPGTLEGAEAKLLDITLDGKAASTSPLELLRGTKAGIDLDLARLTMQGLSVSGKTQFKLEGGRLVSATPLTVNKGKTSLEAVLDFNPKEKDPKSVISVNALNVDANGQMGPILERINPIFHTGGIDAKVDGQIQSELRLTWSGPIDPDEKDWAAAAARSLSGGGTFGARSLNIAGSPVVGEILAVIGQGSAMQGELVASQIQIACGRCRYENMVFRGSRKDAAVLKRDQDQLAADRQELEADKPQLQPREYNNRLAELKQREEDLPFRYTLRFKGWVGFDRRMELQVLMPMTPGMIKAHPNLQKYIGTNFWVDLTGTTEHPRLDMAKMLSEAAKRAAEGVLAEKAGDLLSGLLKNRKREQQAEEAFNSAQKAEAAQNPAGALDLYKRLMKDYSETEFVSKKKRAAIEERIRALQGK